MAGWLLVFYAVAPVWAALGPPPPVALLPIGELTWPAGPAAVGVALAAGGSGELFALFDGPPRIVVWNSTGELTGEFGGVPGTFNAPTDITSDGGMELLVVDPWQLEIARFSRRLVSLPPVVPDVSGLRFEPLSACRGLDGTLYVINQADGDIWRVARDGRATPFGWALPRGDLLSSPTRVNYIPALDRLLVLDGERLRLCDPFGLSGLSFPVKLHNPKGVGVLGLEAWVAGDELTCVRLDSRREAYTAPPDSLRAWGVLPAVDAIPVGDNRLFILPESGGRVKVMRVVRGSIGHP